MRLWAILYFSLIYRGSSSPLYKPPVWDIGMYQRSLNATENGKNEPRNIPKKGIGSSVSSPVWDIDLFNRSLDKWKDGSNNPEHNKIKLADTPSFSPKFGLQIFCIVTVILFRLIL